MQRIVSVFLCLFLSVLVFYGGSGVNAYFYCCGDCRVEGVGAVVEHKCCEIHHHHHHDGLTVTHDHDHGYKQFVSESHGECGVDRIAFDWQSSPGNQPSLQPLVIELDNSLIAFAGHTLTTAERFSLTPCRNRQTQKPPNLSKDDYFSLLTTLII